MFWPDKIGKEIIEYKENRVISKKPLIIRDEKTVSGSSHLGSLRGVFIHGIISEVLHEMKVANKYLYEINDFDIFDTVPHYLDEKVFSSHLGKLLMDVPSPDHQAKNYAEYFGNEFKKAIEKSGFEPDYYYSSILYQSGQFDQFIIEALQKAELIKKIYKNVSGSVKKDWYPLNVVCPNCRKVSTTKILGWDGEKVEYFCGDSVDWASGCGQKGKISPFGGNAKLPWKVEWAAKFKLLKVDVEGAGKDHSTRGGSRDVANHISEEVFNYQPPFDIPYEFFQASGKKMSSSKGVGSSAKEVADILPTEILRLLMLQKEPKKVIEFSIDGDTVPVLFDAYDSLAEHFFSGKKDDYSKLFKFIHLKDQRENLRQNFLPRFSLVSFLIQMPHINFMQEIEKLKGRPLTSEDKAEVEKRKECASVWLNLYAPDKYKFELQKILPAVAKDLSAVQKKAIKKVLDFVKNSSNLDGQAFHTRLHEIKEELSIEPKEMFSALYLIFLGKSHGPKAGWFLSVLDRDFLENRLKEII